LNYFRTGELHKDNAISIYARKVGDEKITVRISQQTDPEVEEESEIRIRVGNLGNLAESQVIYGSHSRRTVIAPVSATDKPPLHLERRFFILRTL
jgi:hypothetical protein